MGEDSLQYFFPSRTWISTDKEIKMEADWLYRNYPLEGESHPRTILNFTLYSERETFKKIPDRLVIRASGNQLIVPSEQIGIIYVDRGKTRFTSWISSEELRKLWSSADDRGLEIRVLLDKELQFSSTLSFQDHILYFQEVLGTDTN